MDGAGDGDAFDEALIGGGGSFISFLPRAREIGTPRESETGGAGRFFGKGAQSAHARAHGRALGAAGCRGWPLYPSDAGDGEGG